MAFIPSPSSPSRPASAPDPQPRRAQSLPALSSRSVDTMVVARPVQASQATSPVQLPTIPAGARVPSSPAVPSIVDALKASFAKREPDFDLLFTWSEQPVRAEDLAEIATELASYVAACTAANPEFVKAVTTLLRTSPTDTHSDPYIAARHQFDFIMSDVVDAIDWLDWAQRSLAHDATVAAQFIRDGFHCISASLTTFIESAAAQRQTEERAALLMCRFAECIAPLGDKPRLAAPTRDVMQVALDQASAWAKASTNEKTQAAVAGYRERLLP